MVLRLHREDFMVIGHYLGSVLFLVALSLLLPVAIALLYREIGELPGFLISMGGLIVFSTALRMLPCDVRGLKAKHAIAVTGFAWIFASLFGAIPLYMSGHYRYLIDALFESVSGFSTTGLSIVIDVDHMSMSMNMWRFETQLIGGQGVLVAALAMGMFSKRSRMAVAMYESEGRSERALPDVRETGRFIWRVSGLIIGLMTAVGTIAILVAGVPADRAVLHSLWIAISAFDTGGFSPQTNGLVFYHSFLLEIVTLVTGFLGALNFVLYADISKDRRAMFRDIETRTWFIWTTVIFVIAMLAMVSSGSFTGLPALVRRGAFMVMSAATNTGIMNMYPAQMIKIMGSSAVFTLVIAMTVAGCSGSASGGIKALRVGLIAKSIAKAVKSTLLPDSAVVTKSYHHGTRHILSDEAVSAACTITVIYLAVYVIGAIAGILMGYSAIPAMFESVSAASNNGLSSGLVSFEIPTALKVVYILEMLAGRFEFVTLFALVVSLVASGIPKRHAGRLKSTGGREPLMEGEPYER